jgi:ATP-binding protein involved in chromosome partitioning
MPTAPPTAIQRRDDGILITWAPGTAPVLVPARALRLACPCAECVEEMSGAPLLDPARVPLDVRPAHLELVGSYALRVRWSDGHGTGLFTWEALRGVVGEG